MRIAKIVGLAAVALLAVGVALVAYLSHAQDQSRQKMAALCALNLGKVPDADLAGLMASLRPGAGGITEGLVAFGTQDLYDVHVRVADGKVADCKIEWGPGPGY